MKVMAVQFTEERVTEMMATAGTMGDNNGDHQRSSPSVFILAVYATIMQPFIVSDMMITVQSG